MLGIKNKKSFIVRACAMLGAFNMRTCMLLSDIKWYTDSTQYLNINRTLYTLFNLGRKFCLLFLFKFIFLMKKVISLEINYAIFMIYSEVALLFSYFTLKN